MTKIMFLHSGAELYGADRILIELVTNLNKERFEPIVVLPNEGPLVEKLQEKNIKTIIISYPIIRRKYFNIKGIFNYLIEYKKSCKKLISLAKEENVDLIHSNTIAVLEGIYIHKKTKIPLITHIHEMLSHPKIVAKILYKLAIKNSNKVIVVSNAVKNYIKNIIKVKKDNIEVIHNGIDNIDNSKIDTDYLYKELNIPKDAKVIATIGRINAIKGQDDFIDALVPIIKENNNVYGLIVGDAFSGQEWRIDKLKQKIKETGLEKNILYLGFRTDVINIQKMMNIYVLPSVQYDSFPTVVLEAMRFGKPVVAYDCGGVREMIEDNKSGFLVPMGDEKGLEESIKKLIYNDTLINNFKLEINKKINEEFGINVFIEKFEEKYTGVTNGREKGK